MVFFANKGFLVTLKRLPIGKRSQFRNRLFLSVFVFLLSHAACAESAEKESGQNVPTPRNQIQASGRPTSTAVFQGNGQTAFVDQPVTVPPGLLVTDAQGVPVAGVEVTFSVAKGKGRVGQGTRISDARGVALVGEWTLGPTPGFNELKAEVPGLAPVFYQAQALPDARGSFVILKGDNLTGRVSEATEFPPTVVFRNQDGSAAPGRNVTFRVDSGEGTVSVAQTTTDTQGMASAGIWTLGPIQGAQKVTASSPGMPDLEFVAWAVSNIEPVVKVEKVLGGLHHPWELVFLPDGSLLFTERGGNLSLLPKGANQKLVLATLTDIPDSQATGKEQSGHLGLALDPNFSSNAFVYSFVTSNLSNPVSNHIRKWKMGADLRSITFQQDIFVGLTYGSNGGHSGGRIGFGPDGTLYIGTGDTRAATVPQDLQVLGGKLLRITTQGAPASGNPLLGPKARPEIYSYGFRNPQGLAFRRETSGGGIFTCEHGPNQDDEVTRIQKGGNGGWNPNDGNGGYNGYSGAIMTDLKQFPNALKPVFREADSNGMSDCVFLEGPQWKSWEGKLAVGMLAGQRIFLADINTEGTGLRRPLQSTFFNQGRVRSLTLGPDGNLYVVIDANSENDGRIVKLTPQ
jgi:aldose sugar dehydrogenase